MSIFFGFFGWFVLAIFTGAIASGKNRDGIRWFILGCIFPILSFLAILVLPTVPNDDDKPSPKTHVKCPDCKEFVLKDANVCKHCGCKLVPQ
jgi:hypothetical protein